MEDDKPRTRSRVKFDANRIEDYLADMDILFALETGTHKHIIIIIIIIIDAIFVSS